MTLNYYPSESDTSPDELDTVSSPTTVYFRRNIEVVEVPDEGLTSRTVYKYEEAKVPTIEYIEWLAEKNQADLEYLYMMTEVDYLE
jgi:hypothetical protein